MRDDRPLIRTRDDLLQLIAHVLRLQLSYFQALAVADTILRTLKAARLSIRRRRYAGIPQKRRYGKPPSSQKGTGLPGLRLIKFLWRFEPVSCLSGRNAAKFIPHSATVFQAHLFARRTGFQRPLFFHNDTQGIDQSAGPPEQPLHPIIMRADQIKRLSLFETHLSDLVNFFKMLL